MQTFNFNDPSNREAFEEQLTRDLLITPASNLYFVSGDVATGKTFTVQQFLKDHPEIIDTQTLQSNLQKISQYKSYSVDLLMTLEALEENLSVENLHRLVHVINTTIDLVKPTQPILIHLDTLLDPTDRIASVQEFINYITFLGLDFKIYADIPVAIVLTTNAPLN